MDALTTTPDSGPAVDFRNPVYQDLKSRIHEALLGRLNLERLAQTKREDAEPEIRSLIEEMLELEGQTIPPGIYEPERIIDDVLYEIF